MSEYLIFFNDEWVTDASDEQWRRRSRDVRAVVEEMKAAGVFIFTGGLDNGAAVFHVEPHDGAPVFTDGPYAAVDVPDEAAARHWAGRIAVACDWPQEVRILRTPGQIPSPDADHAGAHTKEV